MEINVSKLQVNIIFNVTLSGVNGVIIALDVPFYYLKM